MDIALTLVLTVCLATGVVLFSVKRSIVHVAHGGYGAIISSVSACFGN